MQNQAPTPSAVQLSLFPPPTTRLEQIDPDRIDADPDQPRTTFAPDDHRRLMASIALHGVMEPLVVEEVGDGRYRLVAGERRLRAVRAVRAEDHTNPRVQRVPALVYPSGALSESARAALQLAENFFRRDLAPGELARGLMRIKRAEEVRRAEDDARRFGVLPSDYDPAAPLADRERALRQALRRAGRPWPEVPWPAAFRAAGLDPQDPALRSVRKILSIPDPLLDRCDRMGLSRSAAEALAELRDDEKAAALLDAVEKAGDPGLVTPAVDLLVADPSLDPARAVEVVLASRRAVDAARRSARERGDDGQLSVSKPPCPPAEFERLVAALRQAVALLETWALAEYQRGSVRLWVERLLDAVPIECRTNREG